MDLKSKLYPFDIDENVCGVDRVLRLVIGTVLAGLAIFYFERILLVILSLLMSFVLFLNVVTSRCKVNEIIGLDTCQDTGSRD